MSPATAPAGVRIAAHAKTNLLLRILARDQSGYHQLETAFVLLELADDIVVTPTARPGEVTLTVEGPDLGPPEQNLAVRAARAVLDATGHPFGAALHLVKRIPAGAGLGGGSSDAAAVLHAVNALANHAVPRSELLHFATRLGADVAFFASGAPAALGWGRGERIYRLAPLPAAPALVLVPPFAVATAEAYRWWDEMHAQDETRGPIVLDADALATWGSVGRLGGNDFELPVFGRYPALRTLYEQLAATAPLWVRLCGSGSALAAVYKSERNRDDAVAAVSPEDALALSTTTRAAAAPGPSPVEE